MPIDVLSSTAICGAGALVAAAVLRPSLAFDDASAEALRLSRRGFVVLGLSLGHIALLAAAPPLWSQAVMAGGTLSALLLLGWALAALSRHPAPQALLVPALVIVVGAVLAGLPYGTKGLTIVCTWGLFLVGALGAVLARRLVLRPRDAHELLLGLLAVALVASGAVRVVFLHTWDGPYEPHFVYLPPALLAPVALMHGVLPVVYAMALSNVVNARLQSRLHERAATDQLTGLLARQALIEGVGPLLEQMRQGRIKALAMVMIDLDHFKLVNDRHGHAVGDAVLRLAARLLRGELRGSASLGRFGGEEFVALLPVEDLGVAQRVAGRMREALEGADWSSVLPRPERVTASLGLTMVAHDESFERALARADEALYVAKNGGRNQVQVRLAGA